MRNVRPTVLVAAVAGLAALLGPACGSSPTTPTPPPAACTYQVTASGQSFGAGGGSSTLTITTGSGCAWTATANEAWVTFGSSPSGSGPGSVTMNVAPNTATSSRQCAVSVAGQSVSLAQEGAAVACVFAVTPASERFGPDGDTRTFKVETGAACPWTAVSDAPWLMVTSGASGTGPGTIGYAVAAWTGADERTGRIRVGTVDFTVRQDAHAPAACEYSVTPVEFTPCMPATTQTAAITTQQGCSWTAAPDASWISVTSGESGSGSGVITFRVSSNYEAPRQGIVKVRWPSPTAGQNLQVQQAGCLYAVSTAAINIAAAGSSSSFDVIQQSMPNTCGGATQDACIWTATSDVPWITVTTSMPQAGDNPVRFTVAPNASTSSRTGTITVRDKTVRITQAGI